MLKTEIGGWITAKDQNNTRDARSPGVTKYAKGKAGEDLTTDSGPEWPTRELTRMGTEWPRKVTKPEKSTVKQNVRFR